jgi:hypothetical protein
MALLKPDQFPFSTSYTDSAAPDADRAFGIISPDVDVPVHDTFPVQVVRKETEDLPVAPRKKKWRRHPNMPPPATVYGP